MRLLTVENKTFHMNELPEEVDDIRYCVLDYSNQDEVDYFFIPLIFLESFSTPAVELKVGELTIQMPMDWSVVIGDPTIGNVEVIPLDKLNARPFSVFAINPLKSYMPTYYPIEINNVFPDIKWYFPKLKFGHLLAIPLSDKPESECAFFLKEVNKIPDVLDISKMT